MNSATSGATPISIAGRLVGPGQPVFIVAEMSANHRQDLDEALRIIAVAKECGADAVKIQTYTADTITLDSDAEHFVIQDTIWKGQKLHDLYGQAYTPWEWQAGLKRAAEDLGMALFSSPFDHTAVDFLESLDMPAYKVASFEVVDLPLLRRMAATGRPVIMSTGMATLGEIDEAVRTLRQAGCTELSLLKCTSAYPANPLDMNLRTIPHLAEAFGVPAGLSDHTLGVEAPVAAVALGACLVEKHFTLSRAAGGPDAAFSLEPAEFAEMVRAVRSVEQALGRVNYQVTERELASRAFRRSLFVAEDVRAGEPFTARNVRSVRPAHGLHTRYLEEILGRPAARDVKKGTPLSWDLVGGAK